jgi:iron complex outermembrane recepter protein
MTKTQSAFALLLLSTASIATPSHAQQVASGLEEIVVTARKRDEKLFDIPVAVSALSKDALEKAGINNPTQLSDFVSGLDFVAFDVNGRNSPNIRIRGMIQQIITPATQVGALFWDGAYVGGGGGFMPIGDLQRVEVIKGPQTAYFGRNTFSGAVNYIPTMPGDVWEGKVSAGYSPSYNDKYDISGAVGGPITDKVGIRVAGSYNMSGGDFSYQDGSPFGQFKDTSFSGTLAANPSDNLRLKVTGYYTTSDDTMVGASQRAPVGPNQCNQTYTGQYLNVATGVRTPFTRNLATLPFATICGRYPEADQLGFPVTRFPTVAQIANGAAGFNALSTLNPLAEKYSIIRKPQGGLGGWHQTYRIQFSGEYDIGGHTIAVLGSRSNTGTTTRTDSNLGIPTTPVGGPISVIGMDIYQREFYYETRLTSPQDQRFRYMVGISDYDQHYGAFTDPARPAPVDRQLNKTFGVFVALDYDFTDQLTGSLETRYTDESSLAVLSGDPRLQCGLVLVCDNLNEYDDLIPRAILTYKPMSGTTLYASYSYSSLLGVATLARFVNSIAPTIVPASALAVFGDYTAPQENTQYELGWKQQGDNWNATVAAYYVDWKNQPFAAVVQLPTAGTTSLRGAGKSRYKGIDFEGNLQATDWLTLSAQIGYSDAKMISFSSRGSEEQLVLGSGSDSVVADGNPIRQHPELTGSLSPTISGSLDDRQWSIRADVIYTDSMYGDYSKLNLIPDSTRVNLRANIDLTEAVNLEIYGTNIFNELSFPSTASTLLGPLRSPGVFDRKIFTGVIQRRNVGMRVNAKF